MKKTLFFLMLIMGTIMLGFTACGDDDPEPKPTPVTPKDTTSVEPKDTTNTNPQPQGKAAIGWPANYGGVMLQAFYWDSFDDSQWTVLEAQADQMKGTFDLVWLP